VCRAAWYRNTRAGANSGDRGGQRRKQDVLRLVDSLTVLRERREAKDSPELKDSSPTSGRPARTLAKMAVKALAEWCSR
jgi:hypothetical protein